MTFHRDEAEELRRLLKEEQEKVRNLTELVTTMMRDKLSSQMESKPQWNPPRFSGDV